MMPADIDILVVMPQDPAPAWPVDVAAEPAGSEPAGEMAAADGLAGDADACDILSGDADAVDAVAGEALDGVAAAAAAGMGNDLTGDADTDDIMTDDRASIIVLEAGQAVEFFPLWEKGRLHKGDIVLGVVRRHVPHLGGVFVQVGSGHDGLLRLAQGEPVPKDGSRVMVMISRESRAASQTGAVDKGPAMADKGPLLTRKLAIASRHAVLRPGQWPLRRSVLQTMPAADAEQLFQADLKRLEGRLARLEQDAAAGPAPRLLMAAGDMLLALANAYGARLHSIQAEGVDRYRRVEALLQTAAPDLLPLLRLHPPHFTYGLATVHRAGDLARQVRSRTVRLPCGGTLVFDRTEALHVIDVNSGACRDASPEALADKVNREAVREIARQLRLRNLSGMILIDLIHQKDAARREVHAAALREATARDRGPVTVYGFTALQLLELTRRAH